MMWFAPEISPTRDQAPYDHDAWGRNGDAIAVVMTGDDAEEGPRALAEKRDPVPQGR